MANRNPRLMVVLEPRLYSWIKKTAKSQRMSLSLIIRDLIKEAYSDREDFYWSQEGDKRIQSFKRKSALSHDETKKRLKL